MVSDMKQIQQGESVILTRWSGKESWNGRPEWKDGADHVEIWHAAEEKQIQTFKWEQV